MHSEFNNLTRRDFSSPPGPAFCLVRWRGFGNTHFRLCINRLEDYADMGVQSFGYAAEHTEGMAFIAGRLKPADLLLGSLQKLRQFLLRKPGLLPENGDLQRHIPGLSGALKA